jgi:hypothetical protein
MSDKKENHQNLTTEEKDPVPPPKLASRSLALIACIATLVFSGVMNGALDGRWANRTELEEHGQRLQQAPKIVGDWILIKEEPLDADAQAMLQCHGSLTRYYRNRITGEEVGLLLIYGPRGPVAVHVPEICYSSVGTFPSGAPVAKSLSDSKQDSFWVTQFDHASDGKSAFEVWYAWSTGTDWEAANHPRFWITDQLYKIQVAGPATMATEEKSPVERFLDVFIPILRNGAVSPIM